ncbi:MAG: hypothetical protein WCO30_02795 [bacterium]
MNTTKRLRPGTLPPFELNQFVPDVGKIGPWIKAVVVGPNETILQSETSFARATAVKLDSGCHACLVHTGYGHMRADWNPYVERWQIPVS